MPTLLFSNDELGRMAESPRSPPVLRELARQLLQARQSRVELARDAFLEGAEHTGVEREVSIDWWMHSSAVHKV